jgi:hypothetical protein
MFSVRILLASFIVVVALGQAIFCQQASSSQLALEVYFYPNEPPAYQKIYKSQSGGTWYSRFHQIKSPGLDDLPVNAVDIKPSFTDDGIRVTVSVLFGELHEKQKQVGVYTIHEGDKIKIQELTQFGIDPFIISVVNFSPALFDLPEFISKAKSIEYIGIQPAVSTMPAFRVAVRNLSSKNVRAILVRTLKGGVSQLSFLPQGKEGAPLIQPGNAFEFDARVATRATPTPTGYTQVTLPGQVIEVITAVFDDGSFEGEAGPALIYAATLRGEKIQLARMIDLFQRAIDDHQSDPGVTIEALKKNIGTLNVEADPALAAEIIGGFGQPVKETAQELKGPIEIGMKTISSHALNMTKQFQLRNPRPEMGAVDRWLTTLKERYEDWLHRL